jgi:hypothetical protein
MCGARRGAAADAFHVHLNNNNVYTAMHIILVYNISRGRRAGSGDARELHRPSGARRKAYIIYNIIYEYYRYKHTHDRGTGIVSASRE